MPFSTATCSYWGSVYSTDFTSSTLTSFTSTVFYTELATVFTPCGIPIQLSHTKEDASCLPPDYSDVLYAHDFYSPGICPDGYTIGCYPWTTYMEFSDAYYTMMTYYDGWIRDPEETAAFCVPNYFQYAGNTLTTSLSVLAIEVRWKQSDIDQNILETHPLSPGVFLSTSATTTAPNSSSPTADATDDSTGATCTGSASDCDEPSGGGLSAGAKAGIGVGVVVAVVVVALIFWLIKRKRREHHIEEASREQPFHSGVGTGPQIVGEAAVGGDEDHTKLPIMVQNTPTPPNRMQYDPYAQAQTHGGSAGDTVLSGAAVGQRWNTTSPPPAAMRPPMGNMHDRQRSSTSRVPEMEAVTPTAVFAELSGSAPGGGGVTGNPIQPDEATWASGNVAVPPAGQQQVQMGQVAGQGDSSSTTAVSSNSPVGQAADSHQGISSTHTPEAVGWGALGAAMSPTEATHAWNPPQLQPPGQQRYSRHSTHSQQEGQVYGAPDAAQYQHQPQSQEVAGAVTPRSGDEGGLGDLMKRQSELQARRNQLLELQRIDEEELRLREQIHSLQGTSSR
ncbi:transmembrane alpha-helix domain-containing [Zalerion maritima]|uniref:Transmembrane alpha-helix domain-containing n=1 Tax=Zalerion maritima TaxID=339359 RepID=A0AAD5RMD6_9PEZI|nr:transmembrane alpha-helix domain-containing [Zalerion maritima]